jgi:hypothetical protein
MGDNNLLSGELSNLVNFIAASGGLGTAAMGVVDATKGLAGGPSRVGFGEIKSALRPFLNASRAAGDASAPGRAVNDMIQTLRANWMNGVALTDQKTKAKALIHLGLTAQAAPALAGLAGVDGEKLTNLARKVANGTAPAPDELNVLGQFDVVLAAVLDAAYERADQKYRNGCKLLATIVALAMAAGGGWAVPGAPGTFGAYLASSGFGISLLAGLLATPLAPVAKDLVTSLQVAAATKLVR